MAGFDCGWRVVMAMGEPWSDPSCSLLEAGGRGFQKVEPGPFNPWPL